MLPVGQPVPAIQLCRELTQLPEARKRQISEKCLKAYKASILGNREASDYFLSRRYQLVVAKQLNIDVLTIEGVRQTLRDVARATPIPPPLRGLVETPELQNFNKQIKQTEAQILRINSIISDARRTRSPIVRDLEQLREELRNKLQFLLEEKAAYVKVAYAADPVYAMGIAITVPAGSVFWTGCSEARREQILGSVGFSWFEEAGDPATRFAHNFQQQGIWAGGNEMGEKGWYFTKDTPNYHYTEPEKYPEAIKCVLQRDMDGLEIVGTSKLNARSLGFSGEQIDRGYRTLQARYGFVRCADSPDGTEYIFQRSENNLRPVATISAYTMDEEEPIAGELHPSWSAVPAPAAEAAATPAPGVVAAEMGVIAEVGGAEMQMIPVGA